MVASGKVRASGKTTVAEVTEEEAKENEELPGLVPESRRSIFRTPGFSRMRIDWQADDRIVLHRARDKADNRLFAEFADCYQILNHIFDLVRQKKIGADGQPEKDAQGWYVWDRDEYGNFNEDWDRLTRIERENLLFAITTRLFAWSQKSADAWGEAMFAKSQWEERYAIDFDEAGEGTVQWREAQGRKGAADERYFAVLLTLYSKKTEALVRSMELIAQRLRDALMAGR